MDVSANGSHGVRPASGKLPVVPTSRTGWLAVWVAGIGLAAWTVLPVVGGIIGDASPALSSGAMVTGIVLLVLAAVFNLMVVILPKQRSVMNIAAAAVALPAIFVVAFLALGGFFNTVL